MAKYRTIKNEYWEDNFILDLSPEEDRFYFYLLTNPYANQTGIYELPMRIAEMQLKCSREKIIELISKFEEYGKIKYNPQTREIAIKNWAKYNFNTSGNILACINNEIEKIKDKTLITFVYDNVEYYSQYISLPSPLDTHYKPLPSPLDTPTKKEIEIEIEIKKEIESKNKISKKDLENEFEEIWKEYPKKEGKVKSLNFYQKHRKEYSKEQFITAISNYKKKIEREKTEEKYILLGSSFFNGRFIDYVNCAAPTNAASSGGTPGNGKKKQQWVIDVEEDEFLTPEQKELILSGQ